MYDPIPTVTGITPTGGPLAGGMTVTITGQGLPEYRRDVRDNRCDELYGCFSDQYHRRLSSRFSGYG